MVEKWWQASASSQEDQKAAVGDSGQPGMVGDSTTTYYPKSQRWRKGHRQMSSAA